MSSMSGRMSEGSGGMGLILGEKEIVAGGFKFGESPHKGNLRFCPEVLGDVFSLGGENAKAWAKESSFSMPFLL